MLALMLPFLLILGTSQASAQCANPTGTEAQIVYNKDAGVPQYCNNTIWKPMGPLDGNCPNIGDKCADGTIYAGITPANNQKMFVTAVNQSVSTTRWNSASGSDHINPDSDTDGQANANNVVVALSSSAIQLCNNLDLHGHQDWYLPAKDELSILYTNKAAINASADENFVNTYNWSSSENDSNTAWAKRFSDGNEVALGKTFWDSARCVRRNSQMTSIVPDGLVGHWKLDETSGTDVIDYASNNNGTMQGGLTGTDSVYGRVGTALNFDGSADYVDLPHQLTDLMAGDWSISTWFNMNDRTGGGTLYSEGTNAGVDWMSLNINSTNYALQFSLNDNAFGGMSIIGNTALEEGTWYFATVTKSGTTYDVYLNGKLETSLTSIYDPPGIDRAAIGTLRRNSNSAFFNGNIDDVRIYNRALEPNEIAQLYRSWEGKITYDTNTRVPKFFNGDEWRPMGPVKYIPNAVAFDGTTTSLLAGAALSGVTDGTKASGSFWARRNSSGSAHLIFTAQSGRLWARFRPADDRMEIEGYNVDADQVVSINSTTQITDTDWHHFMYSFDMDVPGSATLYMDGVDVTNVAVFGDNDSGGGIGTDNNIEFSATDYAIGSNVAQTNSFLDGAIADLWVDINTYIDLSDPANRTRFYDNGPVNLGTDGSKATGTAPDIFLSGDTEDWHTNKGSGGGFTETGELTDAVVDPGGLEITSGLLGWWRLDETAGTTAGDSSDNNNDMSYQNTPVPYANGKINGALDFEEGDHLKLLNDLGQPSDVTIMGWVNQTGLDFDTEPAGVGTLVNIGTPVTVEMFGDRIEGTYATSSPPWWRRTVYNGTVFNEGWNHIAFTLDDTSNEQVVYVNGVAVATENFTESINWASTTSETMIARHNGGTTYDFIGQMDDVRVYDRALTAEEVLVIYSRSGGFCSNPERLAGTIVYNGDDNLMQYCDGEDWRQIGP